MVEMLINYGVKIIGVIVAIWVGFKVAGWAGRMVHKALDRAKVDATLAQFGGSAVRVGLIILIVISCVGVFGVDTTSFAAVIGAAGLAIGLAFQGTLSNVAAGVMLLLFRPFKLGDLIKVAGELGIVSKISLFTTEMDTLDNRHIILPNGSVFGATIENITHNDKRRVDIDVGCDYGESIAHCRTVLEAAANAVPGTIDEPQVIVLALGGSSVDWQVRVWCNAADYWTVWDATIETVKAHLDAAKIGIPYPQMDVHLNRVDPA
ncbi:MAG: small conductance mechanosensitive channel [Bradymonadia bacterium]|jgi:small conductance mechanosensitive channel